MDKYPELISDLLSDFAAEGMDFRVIVSAGSVHVTAEDGADRHLIQRDDADTLAALLTLAELCGFDYEDI